MYHTVYDTSRMQKAASRAPPELKEQALFTEKPALCTKKELSEIATKFVGTHNFCRRGHGGGRGEPPREISFGSAL